MELKSKKKWSKEVIAKALVSNREFRMRALIKLYSRQTADEQVQENVTHNNGKGFRTCDARFLTSLSKSAIRYKRLTDKQDAVLARKIMVYTAQLTDISNGKR
jgi:hypothetical protein